MRLSVGFVTLALSMGVLATPMPSPHALPQVSVASLGGGSEVFGSFAVTRVSMAEIRQRKEKSRENAREVGQFAVNAYANVAAANVCTNGKAASTYSCSNIDLHGFLSHQALGSSTREGNDVWGWTSSTGREFGIVGQTDGVAFVEILSDGSLKYWGRLATQTVNSIWRDMKVLGDYAYIGAESRNHGLQIFDMRKLLTLTSPKVFSITSDATKHTGFTNSHNIVASEDSKMIYAVGTNKCSGGLYMLDVTNPLSPVYRGCASSDGYVHDAQCVVYTGPTTAYRGKEICFGFNEDTLTIYDMSVKTSIKIISRTTYAGAAYCHQGWIADAGMNYLLSDDELDEQNGTAVKGNAKTSTYIWDIKNLAAPKLTGIYLSQAKSIDHNLYVVDGKAYMSNYSSGLRIVDISSVARDPTGAGFREIGHFDVYPEDDSNQKNEFFGAWSVYPYFRSGFILINSIERGIFSVKYTGA